MKKRTPLNHSLAGFVSPTSFWKPDFVVMSAWLEHAPFAFWLVEAVRPRAIVELGTHHGYSYFSFCQAVQRLGLKAHCYAVDTWRGDEHAGQYGEEVFNSVNEYNEAHFRPFSQLIRSSFDEAAAGFEDGSIDLLHIDGQHYFDDVKHDFETWRPKLSNRAVVLFHDTAVLDKGFGVWRLWRDLSEQFPSFEFLHGHGLGVLGYGSELPDNTTRLAAERGTEIGDNVRDAYAHLGACISQHWQAQRTKATLEAELAAKEKTAVARVAALNAEITRLGAVISEYRSSTSWKVTAPLRALARLPRSALRLGGLSVQGRVVLRRIARTLWRRLPLNTRTKQFVKGALLGGTPTVPMPKQASKGGIAQDVNAIRQSTSWRVTRPLRLIKRIATEEGFTRRHLLEHGRRIYGRLGVYRMLDWPLIGPILHVLKARILGGVPNNQIRRTEQWAGNGSATGRSFSAGPRRMGQTPRLELLDLLRDRNSRAIGDPQDAAIAHARALLAGCRVRPTISVVMPTWNREATVSAALRSVLSQTLLPDEILVSDDGSTDGTILVVETEFAEDIADGRIKIIRNAHEGVAAARNAALAVSTGTHIAYLDSDNTWRPNFLLLMIAAFLESDEISVAYAALYHKNQDTERKMVRGQAFDRTQLIKNNYIDLNIFVHHRNIYTQFGGFRRDITRLVDWEFIVRCTRVYTPVFLPFIGVDYFLSSELNNITLTQPLADNYLKVANSNRQERLGRGVDALRLAYFVYDYPALSQTFVLAEIRELLRMGVDLKIYYAATPDIAADLDFEVESFKISSAQELADLFRQHERNVCHSHFAYPGVTNFVRPACQATGVHYTFMPHAVDIFHKSNRERSKVGSLGSDPLCLKVFVYGDFHRRFLQERGVPREKIAYTFQAVNLAPFERIRNQRSGKGRAADTFRIVAIGRFIEKKGFDDLIRAIDSLRDRRVELDLYGYGPMREKLMDLVSTLKLSNVNFMGSVKGIDALARVYEGADLLVAPCVEAGNGDIDGFPTVILEAMVAGVPVLTTTVSAIPDYVRDGVEGVLVPPRNPRAIANAIVTFLDMPIERRAAMVSRARDLVRRKIGVEKTVQRLMDVWMGYELDIILVTYNTEKYNDRKETFAIIDRIFERTTTNFTLTIVDNDSDTEFWADLVKHVSGRSNVRLIRKRKNVLCGPASNSGIAHGSAEFVIYLCSKEAFIKEHGWERLLIDTMRREPDVGLAGHLVHLPRYLLGSEIAKHPAFPLFRDRGFAEQNPDRIFMHVQGGAKIIRRDMFEAAGGYNDATPQDYMDVELSYQFESLGYRLAQISEVSSVTKTTQPGLDALMSESTVVAHPLTVDTVAERLDNLSDRTSRTCNLCGAHFAAFTSDPKSGGAQTCPNCHSLPLERLAYRVLANAPYTHRGGVLAFLGSATTLEAKLSGRMFKRVIAETDVARFSKRLQENEFVTCCVIDTAYLGSRGASVWTGVAQRIAEHGEMIVVEPHDTTRDDISGTTIDSHIGPILASRSLVPQTTFFDIASERVGYDWRRLRRIGVFGVR